LIFGEICSPRVRFATLGCRLVPLQGTARTASILLDANCFNIGALYDTSFAALGPAVPSMRSLFPRHSTQFQESMQREHLAKATVGLGWLCEQCGAAAFNA